MIGSRVGSKTGSLSGSSVGSSADDEGLSGPPAAPVWQINGTPAVGTSAGTLTVNWPSHQTDDVALLILSSDSATAFTLSDAQGFVEVTNSPQNNGGLPRLHVWWCRATSGAMTSPTIADSPDDAQKYAVIITFRGCVNSGNPWDVTAGGTNASSTTLSVPGATTTKANTLVAAICAGTTDIGIAQSSGEANADLTGVAERFDGWTIQGSGNGIVVITGTKAAAGAYGATTATLANATTQACLSVALRSF